MHWVQGQTIAARYRLEALLGEGSLGAVYRASDLREGRAVALKAVRNTALTSEELVKGFAEQALVARKLGNENVAALLDAGHAEDGTPYVVHELLQGQTLAELLRARGALPADRVANIAAQVLRALAAAHGRGIVHRDLRPAKIFLCDCPDGRDFVKVLGFGLREAGRDRQAALTRQGFGDPSYLAPEQVHGVGVGPAADLYALGLVMAEALSGKVIVKAATAEQTAMEHASDKPVALPPQVLQSSLGAVVLRATHKALDRRFGSAEEMLTQLRAVNAMGTGAAAGASLSYAKTGYMPAADAAALVAGAQRASVPTPEPRGPSWPTPDPRGPSWPTPEPRGQSWPTPDPRAHTWQPAAQPPSQPWPPPQPYATMPTPPQILAPPIARAAASGPKRSGGGGLLLALLIGGGLLGMLAIAGGVIWLLMEEGPKPAADAPARGAERPAREPVALGALDEATLKRRLEGEGWTVGSTTTTSAATFNLLALSVQRSDGGGSVQLYKYEDTALAATVAKQLETTTGAVARDGGTILLVVVLRVGGDSPGASRALLASLTGRR